MFRWLVRLMAGLTPGQARADIALDSEASGDATVINQGHGVINIHHPDPAPETPISIAVPQYAETRLRGRDELLARLTGAWSSPDSRVRILYGLGGCGKTTIVAELARRVSETVDVWWLSAADEDQWQSGIRALAQELGMGPVELQQGRRADELWKRLHAHRQQWLLIIDGADDLNVLTIEDRLRHGRGWLRPVHANSKGLVVVTTRDQGEEWPEDWCLRHRVPVLPTRHAAQVLMDYTKGRAGKRSEAAILADRLGGLPLALKLAGAYLAESTKRFRAAYAKPGAITSFAAYVTAVDTGKLDLGQPERKELSPKEARQLIRQTWELSLSLLDQREVPEARPILRLLACFADAPIPYQLLIRPELLRGTDIFPGLQDEHMAEVLACLEDFGLIDVLPDPVDEDAADTVRTVKLHVLVRDASRANAGVGIGRDERGFLALGRWLLSVAARNPEVATPEDPASWPLWGMLGPHCLEWLEAVAVGNEAHAAHEAAEVGLMTVHYLGARGSYALAEERLREVLAVQSGARGADQAQTLTIQHEMAGLIGVRGRYEEAEALFREVLANREAVLGAAHPDTLITRYELARILGIRGDYAEAERLFREVAAARATALGPEEPKTISASHGVAWVIGEMGRYAEAETLFRDVMVRRTHVLGSQDPHTLTTGYEVARMVLLQERYEDAEQLFRQLSKDLHDLLVNATGLPDRGAAQMTFRDLFSPRAALLGAERLDTLNLGPGPGRGQALEAAVTLVETLRIACEHILTADHPHTLHVRTWIAWLWSRQGQTWKARREYKAVLEARKWVLGEQHPATVRTEEELRRLSLSPDRN
ncbi:tetratricopeptide repeat protein [Acrocarpospora macrocephala]|uniref:ATP/GTP-binding protein n=2 Tax=Acrocarpospora macrocephala TaxID=150177 RepID=A0A5M3X3E4_9ACTN|nr:tetratricopeptide repeat protein [Acrocarpospora macrocephala]GES16265.1 ATP/GTP-binding protein [Acrocarpospora macrocephala]